MGETIVGMYKPRAARSVIARVITFVGIVCILTGLSFLGYVGWQYFGTNIVSKQQQEKVTQELVTNWDDGIDGDAIGLLRVERFGNCLLYTSPSPRD